ncbi:MAG: hypothetical protein ABIY71_03915 [Flavobacteriales bacterium]
MRVELKEPVLDKELTMVVTETAGHELIGQDHDKIDHRCVIAFFKRNPEVLTEKYELQFPIQENGQGALHTVTAIAVLDTTVLATDRKRIRSGTRME